MHADESTLAIVDQGTGELTTRPLVGRPHELLPVLRDIERLAWMVYEAGPTGYGLARGARADGIEMVVFAPGCADRAPNDRIKTDKRDAVRVAGRLVAGELTLCKCRRSSMSTFATWCAAARTSAATWCAPAIGGNTSCAARSTTKGERPAVR